MRPRIKGFLDLFLLAPVFFIALLTVNALGQTNCAPPPSGLVSWWRAETNALDATDGNHGTVSNGITFTSGKVGQAFQFDGLNGAVVIPAATNLAFTSLTIEGWIRPVDLINQCPIVEYANPTGPASMVLWYNIGQDITPNHGGLLAFLRSAD